MDDWLVRTCEIVDKYRPKIIFFDWWIQIESLKPYLRKFAAYYYNRADEWGEGVAINYKNDAFMHQTAVRNVERGQLSNVSPDFWQCDTTVANNSWCYTHDNDYKDSNDIICNLIDIVSKNGTLLLNIGPRADGTIPEEDKKILCDVGKWLKINGEGIYDTKYWKKFGEGPTQTPEGHFTDDLRDEYTDNDFRFTYNNGCLYVFSMKWPEDGVVRIKSLGVGEKCAYRGLIKNAEILGCDAGIQWLRCKDYLTIIAPEHKSINPVCVKITLG
jgi:alpha-L-fucosidase